LKKSIQGGDGRADVGHEHEEQVVGETARRKMGDEAVANDVMERRMDHERGGDVDEVPNAEHEGDLLPRPVAPVTIMPMTSQQPITVSQAGMPKMLMAVVMPMNSVIIVSQSVRTRSRSENQPQNDPKAQKMASAWPRFVTAPRRTVIS